MNIRLSTAPKSAWAAASSQGCQSSGNTAAGCAGQGGAGGGAKDITVMYWNAK